MSTISTKSDTGAMVMRVLSSPTATIASIRDKVEHQFRMIKCQLGFTKTRYCGLKKNNGKLAMLFTLANIVRVDQMLRA